MSRWSLRLRAWCDRTSTLLPQDFRRREDGVVAVEFAILALPFFLLVFAVLETSTVFVGEMTVEQATSRMGRTVRTGDVAKNNVGEGEFRRKLCAEIPLPVRCDGLHIDLRSYSTFSEVGQTPLTTAGEVDIGALRFETARPGEIMALRVFYEWPLTTDIVRKYLSQSASSTHLIVATDVFKTEPF